MFLFVLLQGTDKFAGLYHDMKMNDGGKAWLHGFLTSSPDRSPSVFRS